MFYSSMFFWKGQFKIEGQRKKERLKRTCKKQVEKESMMFGLDREDALGLSDWNVIVTWTATKLR